MFARLVIFFVFASLSAFTAHLFFGSIIFAAAQKDVFNITLRDTFHNETHELSGIVMVPTTCHDLSVRTKDFDAGTTFLLFETWEQPYRIDCVKESTPRAVKVIVFGPKNVVFRAMMDEEIVPISIVRTGT